MLSKRGTFTMADLLYWFFYIPLTAFLILALVLIPGQAYDRMIQPVPLDAAIMHERIDISLSHYSPVEGFQEELLSDQFKRAKELSYSEKQFAYKITVGNEEFVSNEEFYGDAAPLVPIKYDGFHVVSTKNYRGQATPIAISQVYPKTYQKVPI